MNSIILRKLNNLGNSINLRNLNIDSIILRKNICKKNNIVILYKNAGRLQSDMGDDGDDGAIL
jgi:hypothetical protein